MFLQVYPLSDESCRNHGNDLCLSSPVVKSYLSSQRLRVFWDVDMCGDHSAEENCRYHLNKLKVYGGTACIGEDSKSSQHNYMKNNDFQQCLDLPVTSLPSQDPTALSGIPCVLRVYQYWDGPNKIDHSKREEEGFVVSDHTLIQIMSPIFATILNQTRRFCSIEVNKCDGAGFFGPLNFFPSNSLKDSLFCSTPLSHDPNEAAKDEQVLSCFAPSIRKGLQMRMNRLLSNPILIGTTSDAYNHRTKNVNCGDKMCKAVNLHRMALVVDHKEETSLRHQNSMTRTSDFGDDVALTVYNDICGSSKTALVTAIARSVVNCHKVHVLNGSTIFANFGANGSDIALESMLHQIIISAAIEALANGIVGSICVILDQLDSFLPCSRPQYGGNLEPSTPSLNANGAFLNKLLHSLTTKRFFPFPTRNPYYNMNGAGGNVFPIKLCIVGVVGCDERQLKDADQNDKSILDILGRNIFRIPNGPYGQRSKKTRAQNLSECEVFKSIGGNNDAKKMLEDVLAISKRKKILLRKFGLSLPTGVLLYGPPGTGKTLLAKATSRLLRNANEDSEIEGTFIPLNASDIVCAEVGRSEKLLTSTFESARKKAPSVIFIDEFQALFTSRDKGNGSGTKGSGRLASTLITLMDDIRQWKDANTEVAQDSGIGDKRVVVLAATNTPWLIDGAFMRAGRFDRVVHVKLPTELERFSILKVHINEMKLAQNCDVDQICRNLASECKGYSGADLSNLVRAAASRCVQSSQAKVKLEHFLDAKKFDVVQPSSDVNLVSRLNQWKP